MIEEQLCDLISCKMQNNNIQDIMNKNKKRFGITYPLYNDDLCLFNNDNLVKYKFIDENIKKKLLDVYRGYRKTIFII